MGSETGRPVHAERGAAVLVLRIDRPERRNALSLDVLEALGAYLDEAEFDVSVRVVVLAGGSRVFASGADVRELRDTAPTEFVASRRQALWQRFARFPKPLVAAPAGFVLGGGCELVLLCDVVAAGDNAVFGQPEIRLGIIPGAGGTQRWARATSRYRAAGAVLTGQTVDAREFGAGDIHGSSVLLVLGFESAQHPTETLLHRGLELCTKYGGETPEGIESSQRDIIKGSTYQGAIARWRRHFVRAPYWTSALVRLGIFNESFETACTWDKLPDPKDAVTESANEALREVAVGKVRITLRFTHVYPDWPAPYFTVRAPVRHRGELQAHEAVEAAVSKAILSSGGTITHHHAVGRQRRAWYEEQRPVYFGSVLQKAKSVFDPAAC